MAEIKIEKKTAIWPWILGVIVLAILIYFLFFQPKVENNMVDDRDTISRMNTDPVSD